MRLEAVLHCPQCGGATRATDRFCEACGAVFEHPDTASPVGKDRIEQDLGRLAAVSDRGRVHTRNEDAYAIALEDRAVVAVVCDGVSSSTAGDVAARVAADAAGRALQAGRDADPAATLVGAIESAREAVAGVAWSPMRDLAAPSTTIVAATCAAGLITVAGLGDSRAYWIDDEEPVRLTRDDSWAEDQVTIGRLRPDEALLDARAHMITAWLGTDAPTHPPAVVSFRPVRRGRLLLCSDGLWNSWPEPDDLAELVFESGAHHPIEVARALTDRAVVAGGRDNITVVVADVDPTTTEPREGLMTTFGASVHQNQFLAVGASRVDALVRVTASGSDDGAGSAAAAPARSEILILDVSGSMAMPQSKFKAAVAAALAAIDCIEDGTSFGILAGSHEVRLAYPGRGMAVADADTRSRAKHAVRNLRAGGGTAIGAWLQRAANMFASAPAGIHHAILMTDGQNQNETPEELAAAIEECTGRFQCDCRGVGDDWEVDELRAVSSALLGSVDIIPDATDADALTADFVGMMRSAMGKAVADATLRLWTPRNASVEFVKQVLPSIEDLTARRVPVSDLVGDYPTGAWGDEIRDFHVRINVPARAVGDEMLAGRVSLVVGDTAVSEAKLVAIWTDDAALSTKIDREVARAAGNSELAEQIQEGIRAWEAGDDATATVCIGRAAQLAYEAGDEERLQELAAIAEISDPATGTVVIRKDVDKVAAMTLDAHSTKTVITPALSEPGVP